MNTPMKNEKLSKLWTRSLGILGLAFIPFLTSCLDDEDHHAVDPTPVAYVSFYHGSPATPGLSIEVDNTLYNSNSFDYSTYFDYYNFRTGKRNFSFNAVNAANSLLDTVVTFEPDKTYSFFISDDEESFLPVIVEDELETPAAGKAMIRLVHLSPDAPEVSLQLGGEETDLFEDQAYREVSEFVEIDAERADFNLKTSANGETVVDAKGISIKEGRIYTLVVRGYVASSSNNAHNLSLQLIRNYPNY